MRHSQLFWTVAVDGKFVERGSRVSNYRGDWLRNSDWRKTVRECMSFWADLKPTLRIHRFSFRERP